MPEVTVVIPSYNHAAYIAEAVRSVLDQTFSDLELVVVDDGSRDQSLEVLASFSDPRMRVIAQENRGAHAAITRGLREGRGEYLAVLNSDDLYHPQRLEKLLPLFRDDPALSLAASYIEIIDAQGKSLGIKHGYQDAEPWLLPEPGRSFRSGNSLHAALLTENYLATTSNYLFPRRLFEQVGELRPLRYTHDWDFALRLTQIGRLALLPEPLMRYRVHASNTIRENQAAMIFEICWILAVHLPANIGGTRLSQELGVDEQARGLLHSVYVYGCEAVLVGLLARRLDENQPLALRLLDPSDGERKVYLAYIQDILEHDDSAAARIQAAPGFVVRLRRLFSSLRQLVKPPR